MSIRHLLLIAAGLFAAHQPLASPTIGVPLAVPHRFVGNEAGKVLGFDVSGRGELRADDCNRLELADARSSGEGELLVLSMELVAHGGLRAFGRCRGPDPWRGRVHLKLMPSVSDDGLAIIFAPQGAELRQQDDSDSLLTEPSRILAEELLLPRMDALRVDVSEPLGDIDNLIGRFLGDEDAPDTTLVSRGRVTAVGTNEQGLRVVMEFEPPQPVEAVPLPAPDLSDADAQQWQRLEDALDGFVTLVVRDLAGRTADRDLQLDLLAVLTDARLRVAELLAGDNSEEDSDPVRELFLDTWSTLTPLLSELAEEDPEGSSSLEFAAFMAAGDALRLLDGLGPEYGIDISQQGLLRLAEMLLSGETPAALTPLPLEPDPELRRLYGLGASTGLAPLGWHLPHLLFPVAWAAEPSPAELLRRTFPEPANPDPYLTLVSALLDEVFEAHLADTRLSDPQRALYIPMVRATAWKETCWRHYLARDEQLQVIRSPVGAVGMMQIVGRVWRSVYDLERLESDVEYNVQAGMEILEHYFLDYAVRRGEDRQPGGPDNLVKATYAAYNGGPSRLTRYRNPNAASRARAVDAAFFRTFEAMREAPWPSDSRCYSG